VPIALQLLLLHYPASKEPLRFVCIVVRGLVRMQIVDIVGGRTLARRKGPIRTILGN
jgi:hypothetical protein